MTTELVAIVNWLAEQTGAEVVGNVTESTTLEFRPKFHPSAKHITRKEIRIDPGSMLASSMLHFQTILPFLLYIGSDDPDSGKAIDLRLKGATYSPGAPSFEYMDQVFLPALRDYFGVDVICQLVKRGWDRMTRKCLQEGTVRFKIRPRKTGTTLRPNAKLCDDDDMLGSVDSVLTSVDATIITPPVLHEPLQSHLQGDIEARFGNIDVGFKVEESGHDDRVYVLLVGKSKCRWLKHTSPTQVLCDVMQCIMRHDSTANCAMDRLSLGAGLSNDPSSEEFYNSCTDQGNLESGLQGLGR
jgi:RNA 3'-terminal phosphate cyclase (ATP)